MPDRCCVYQCTKIKGFRFPKNSIIRKRWIFAVRRDKWTPSANSIVCDEHFQPEDFISGPTSKGGIVRRRRQLKWDAVPTVFKWNQPPSELCNNRRERAVQRQLQKEIAQATHSCHGNETNEQFTANLTDIENIGLNVELQEAICEEQIQTDLVPTPGMTATTACSPKLCVTTQTMLGKPPPFLSIELLQFDQELLHYYTGLETYHKFTAVFRSLGPAVNHLQYLRTVNVISISPVNQFLLMLAKLRQDVDFLPLSRMCGVSVFTAENVFLTWINFCSRQWGEIDTWLPAKMVRYFAPSDFQRKFPCTRVILDGTEVPIEKPSNPLSQRATFSTYKNKNTVKAIAGATPGGLISFVSPSYGGSTSDRQIIERSGLQNLCDPGDSIMADKGFNVQDLFASNDIRINIPAFFSKKNRLSEKQVIDDRKVSSKRVHIERLIGMRKTYKMLVNGLNGSETKLARHIIFVCFTLCNFLNNIVSKDA